MKLPLNRVAVVVALMMAISLATVAWNLSGLPFLLFATVSSAAVLLVMRWVMKAEGLGPRGVATRSWSFWRSALVMALAAPVGLIVGNLSETLGSLVFAGAAVAVVRMEGAARQRSA